MWARRCVKCTNRKREFGIKLIEVYIFINLPTKILANVVHPIFFVFLCPVHENAVPISFDIKRGNVLRIVSLSVFPWYLANKFSWNMITLYTIYQFYLNLTLNFCKIE